MPGRTDRAYLGCNVHAEFDGERIMLVTEQATGEVHEIALDEVTFSRLELYRMGLVRKYGKTYWKRKGKADASEA